MLGGNPSTRTTRSEQTQVAGSTAGMPKLNDAAAFEAVLKEFGTESSKVQWVLIDYVDANTIGIAKKGAGLGVPPVRASCVKMLSLAYCWRNLTFPVSNLSKTTSTTRKCNICFANKFKE